MLLSPKQCPDNHSDPKKRNRPKLATMHCFLNTDYIRAFAIEILRLGLVPLHSYHSFHLNGYCSKVIMKYYGSFETL